MSEHVSKGYLLSAQREGNVTEGELGMCDFSSCIQSGLLCPVSGSCVIHTFARNNEDIGSYAGQKGDK